MNTLGVQPSRALMMFRTLRSPKEETAAYDKMVVQLQHATWLSRESQNLSRSEGQSARNATSWPQPISYLLPIPPPLCDMVSPFT
jgi:hypothetical protein